MANSTALYADTKKLEELSKLLQQFPEVGELAVIDVLRDARGYVTRTLPKLIPQKFAMDADMVRAALKRRKVREVVTNGGKEIGIEIVGPRVNAARFTHSPTAPPGSGKGNRYRAKVTIYNDRGMKEFRPITGADGKGKRVFVARTGAKSAEKIQHIFFVRTGEYKLGTSNRTVKYRHKDEKTKKVFKFRTKHGEEKIRAVNSVAVPQMVRANKVADPLMEGLGKAVDKSIETKLGYTLQQMCDKLNR